MAAVLPTTFTYVDAAGVKPLEKYISAIDSIHSLDQMSEYLCGQNAGFMSNGYLMQGQSFRSASCLL
jgi:hypothetical protein